MEKKKNKNNQKIIEIVEEVLKNHVLDITSEYRDKYFESGVSVFVGGPVDILNDIKDKVNQLSKKL